MASAAAEPAAAPDILAALRSGRAYVAATDRLSTSRSQCQPIESPCLKICVLEPGSKLCRGCGRTIEEIAGWSRNVRTASGGASWRALPARLAARRPSRRNPAQPEGISSLRSTAVLDPDDGDRARAGRAADAARCRARVAGMSTDDFASLVGQDRLAGGARRRGARDLPRKCRHARCASC